MNFGWSFLADARPDGSGNPFSVENERQSEREGRAIEVTKVLRHSLDYIRWVMRDKEDIDNGRAAARQSWHQAHLKYWETKERIARGRVILALKEYGGYGEKFQRIAYLHFYAESMVAALELEIFKRSPVPRQRPPYPLIQSVRESRSYTNRFIFELRLPGGRTVTAETDALGAKEMTNYIAAYKEPSASAVPSHIPVDLFLGIVSDKFHDSLYDKKYLAPRYRFTFEDWIRWRQERGERVRL